MNLDEETDLSAYLDDALDPERRHCMESSLESDVQLSERLRGLTVARDLVAGLSRPRCPVDLSAGVVNRIQERPAMGLVRLIRLGSAGGTRGRLAQLSTAALMLVAVSLAVVAFRVARSSRPVDGAASEAVRARPAYQTNPTPSPTVAGSDLVGPPVELASERLAHRDVPPAATADIPGPDASERLGDAELEKVRRILDSPSLRKVFVLADASNAQLARQVGDLLDRTPRTYSTYICITVDPSLPVDPKRPGGASVFAVVMDDRELFRFRESLRATFPGKLEETDPNPETVTQLADAGQVSVFQGTPVADVRVPDGPPLSLRAEPGKALIPVRPRAPRRSFPPNPDADAGAIDAELAAALAGISLDPWAGAHPDEPPGASVLSEPPRPQFVGPPAPPRERRPASVVLVWVRRPDGGPASSP